MMTYRVKFTFTENMCCNEVTFVLEFSFETYYPLTYEEVKKQAFEIASKKEIPADAIHIKNFEYTEENNNEGF